MDFRVPFPADTLSTRVEARARPGANEAVQRRDRQKVSERAGPYC